ncbi:SAM-dependent methyltransferase [Nocardiopsis coralli]|uniref:SAM-dependent methyltransferase n=1 Tax=Nocardiopsis coralli TaxID=2772213 RepID=UPI002E2E200B|nr:SAM-dependent methyltransferase [Nocardiopsis coralli]
MTGWPGPSGSADPRLLSRGGAGPLPPFHVDTSQAHSVRIWNHWLGGEDHDPPDREPGDRIAAREFGDLTGASFSAEIGSGGKIPADGAWPGRPTQLTGTSVISPNSGTSTSTLSTPSSSGYIAQ